MSLSSFTIVGANDAAELFLTFHFPFGGGFEVYVKDAIPNVLSAMRAFRVVVSNPRPCDVMQMVYAETHELI